MTHHNHELQHTDASQQERFRSLTPEQQTMEIWLNTRETNGHVATAIRDIQEIQHWRKQELDAWMKGVERKLVAASAVTAFVLVLVPTLLTLMNYIEWK